jgi:hypothetical protein
LELLAHRALVSAYFVVARRGKNASALSTAGMRFPTLAADDKAEWLTI